MTDLTHSHDQPLASRIIKMLFRSKRSLRLSPGPDDTGVAAVQIGIHQPIRRSIMPASTLDKRTLVQHAWRSWLAWQASLDHGLHRRGAAEVGRPSLLAAVTGAPFPLRLGLHDVHPVDPRSCASSSMLAGPRIQPSDFLTAKLRGCLLYTSDAADEEDSVD